MSVSKKQRYEHLESLVKDTHTLIFYEAPHKLCATLEDMQKFFGDRKISLCRELTKIYEEVIRTTLSGAIEYYSEKSPRGEYVLVVEGFKKENEPEMTVEEAVLKAKKLMESGMKSTDACKEIAKETGFKKSEIYSRLL